MTKKHPSKRVTIDAAKDLPKPKPAKEREFAASILSSAGNKKKPKKK